MRRRERVGWLGFTDHEKLLCFAFLVKFAAWEVQAWAGEVSEGESHSLTLSLVSLLLALTLNGGRDGVRAIFFWPQFLPILAQRTLSMSRGLDSRPEVSVGPVVRGRVVLKIAGGGGLEEMRESDLRLVGSACGWGLGAFAFRTRRYVGFGPGCIWLVRCSAWGDGNFFSMDRIDSSLVRECCRGVAVVCAFSMGSNNWKMGVAIVCGWGGSWGGCVRSVLGRFFRAPITLGGWGVSMVGSPQ